MENYPLALSAVRLPSPSQFEDYARAVNALPMLSAEHEQYLVKRWNENHDRDAARDLVLSHLRLVIKAVRDHKGYGLPAGDLAQEGTVGLMRAVHGFKPSQGVRLAAYAWKWIEAEIREYIFRSWRLVRLGTGATMKKLFFGYRKTIESLRKWSPDRPVGVTARDVAQAMNLPEDQVAQASQYFIGRDLSLAPPESGSDVPLLGYVQEPPTDPSEDPSMLVEASMDEAVGRRALGLALACLDDRSRDVLISRRLSEPAVPLREVASKWGVSIERVRQIEHVAWSEVITSAQKQLAPPALETLQCAD